jgi:hypothetical protein
MVFVGPEPSTPLPTGPKGGRLGRHPLNAAWDAARTRLGWPAIHSHDLRRWAQLRDTQGATTRELMARAGHASPAAAIRYQHAADESDVAIAQALSGLAEVSRARSAGYSRDGGCERRTAKFVEVPVTSNDEERAADRDRTGIISLEVIPPRIRANRIERSCGSQHGT